MTNFEIIIREIPEGKKVTAANWAIVDCVMYDTANNAKVGFNTMVSASLNCCHPLWLTLRVNNAVQAEFKIKSFS